MARLRKILVISIMSITVISMSMLAVPFQAGAAASVGDLIKMGGSSAVYYLGADGKRYVFPNEQTYFSWYNDFSGVIVIPQAELESYQLGANVTIRPGTKLVKITTNPTVYAVEPGGLLKSIVSEANAIALYGANWAKRVVDVPDSYFTNYKIGAALTAGVYPNGSLVKNSTGADVYYFDGANYRKFDSEAAFTSNRFDFSNVLTSATVIAAAGVAVIANDTALTDTSSGAGGTVGAGTGLTVALSSATAPANTIIAGQAIANLGSFNFIASNDGDVKVTSVKLKRIGVSADATLAAVYLYDGNTRVTDSASVSSGYITFTNALGIVTVAKGTTKALTVKSNIATGSAGRTVGVAINASADIATDGAAVSGSFPANANIMSVSDVTLATVDFNTTTTPTGNGEPAVQNDLTMWQNVVTVGNRAVNLSYITFRQIGSVGSSDIKNFRLYIDGTQVGSAVASLDANGYIAFDLSAASKKIETGSRTFKVVGDVASGSTKTFSLSLRQPSDVVVVDTEYNANVLATRAGVTFSSVSSAAQTIASGGLTITKAGDSPSSNVTLGASDVVLAKYTLKATSEAVKIETLKVVVASSDSNIGSLRNGRLMANNVQIGSTASLGKSGVATTTYTVNYTVVPGADVALEIHADIYDDNGTNDVSSTDTLTISLVAGSNNAQGANSLTLISTPSTDQAANQITVSTGTMTLSKVGTYGNQTVVVPQSAAYKLGSFVLTGSATEDINLNTILVDFTSIVGTTFTNADLSDVYIKHGADTSVVKATVNAANNSWSITKTLTKSSSMTIGVYGKVGSTIISDHSIRADVTISGTTASSGQSVTAGATQGQTIITGTGSIASTVDASSAVSKIIVGASTVDAAAFKFTTTNDSYNITEVVATTTANGMTVISNVSLKDGTMVLASAPLNGTSVTFSGLNIPVLANASKILTVSLSLGSVGAGAGTSGSNVTITLDSFKARNSQGVETTDSTDRSGNESYVYKSIPTVTNVTLPSTILSSGTQVLAKVKVANDPASSIGWKKIVLSVSKSANPTIATTTFAMYDESNNQVAGTWTFSNDALGSTGAATTNATFVATAEQSVSGEKTYAVKATTGGTSVSGDNVNTNIAQASTYAAPAAYGDVSVGATFVWSDQSATSHSETTLDWNNNKLVKNLPTDSQTLSK